MTCPARLDHKIKNGIDLVMTCKREKGHAGVCFPGPWREATDKELDAMWKALPKAQVERAERRMG